MKRRSADLLLSALSLATTAVALEGTVRITHGELNTVAHELSFRQPDARRHHSLIPNASGLPVIGEWRVRYRVNALGLRDHEYGVPKPPGVTRILVVGDSFVEGFGVELPQTAVKVLERRLNVAADGATRFEVVNGGVASYSPLLEYLFLKQDGLALEPDLVMVLYNFSDLRDDEEYEQTARFDARGEPVACAPPEVSRAPGEVAAFLRRHSRAWLYLERKLQKWSRKARRLDEPRTNRDAMVAFRGRPDVVDELWRRNAKYLDRIDAILRQRHVPWALVTYPDALEISLDEWVCGRRLLGFPPTALYPQPGVVAHLASFAQTHGIPLINAYDRFAACPDRPLYYDCDGHCTARGQALLAEDLFEELVSRHLVDPRQGIVAALPRR